MGLYKGCKLYSFQFVSSPYQSSVMYETSLLYSMTFGALFGLLVLRRPAYRLTKACCPLALEFVLLPFNAIDRVVSDYLVYPTLLRRTKYSDRWSRRDVLVLMVYVGATASCILVPLPGIDQAVVRSGTLSLVNFIFSFAGPYLSTLADVLGLSLRSCRRLHSSVGAFAFALAVLHAVVAGAAKGRLDLHATKDLFALVVSRFRQILRGL